MKILAFDTALRACSAAVWVDGEVRASSFEERSRGHAEALLPMIEDVCRRSDTGYEDFDRLAVTIGPGTFAGVRIGIAAARGLAVSLAIPLVGLTTLEVVAAAARDLMRDGDVNLTVVFDARRGQVYTQTFDRALNPLFPPRSQSPVEFAGSLPDGGTTIVGDGRGIVREALNQSRANYIFLDRPEQPDAAVAAGLAAGRDTVEPNSGAPRPLYLRPPDAQVSRPALAPARQ